ncbi:proto-oncogene vav-like isoform X2 [Hypomesus transpacificus]|uniref:proto-oncogene vav-like isoform X2 n=1 Tax=Hypomesus transpacificus TaxID=137520 RepID=UPI001F073109|nr:proto-oncogene vav-like isoform X2 [Hypomesus transpacificus]
MELWRQCGAWLIACRVLPESHRVTWEGAQVCDLVLALRDGVLLCQLLNNLQPHAINLRHINLRPQMSQFLCLKNIRAFLGVCQERFHMRRNELFEAFDLFDVRDFGKVIDTLSILSHSPVATQRGFQPFPLEGCVADDDIYSGLSDQMDDTVEEDDDLYDCVEGEEDEGDEIYEDLMRDELPAETHQKQGVDKRECCLQEITQTEEKYTHTLESIIQHFMKPLQKFLQPQDIESIFINTQDLVATHRGLLQEIRSSISCSRADTLYQVFISYKERLLLYGRYCSQVETASKHLDKMASREDIRMKLEECSKRANSGRFSLRDLLMVPMQRVLKYPLLLQELLKHTTDTTEKENLRTALDAMRDLAQCVNEVKRDNEIIRQITTFQLSIENMTQSLALYGRPKIDGELKICCPEKKSKQDRYVFLFDKAMLVCKRRSGDTMDLKELVELQLYQIRDQPGTDRDSKKWSHEFLLLDGAGLGYDLFFKTRDLKKKWLEQFEMAMSNMCPENCTANSHDFLMHCFEDTTSCKACGMLLRGIFFQGYRCARCKMAAHKECLGRVPACGRPTDHTGTMKKNQKGLRPGPGLPKMEVCQEYYGLPPPPVAFGQPLPLSIGDVIELTRAEVDLQWWEGRNVTIGQVGWFPCNKVQPFVAKSTPDLTSFMWYAGSMERSAAKSLLMSRSDGTFLVRQKEGGEFAISIKFNMDIRHIRITSCEGLYRINDKKAFKGLIDLVQFYQGNSLKEYFKDVDTTLEMPYKQPDELPDELPAASTPPQGGGGRYQGIARARYDFSARDRTELSLREGDTIKILSRRNPSWWKGEVYGRVGLFPANYVEEDYSEYC